MGEFGCRPKTLRPHRLILHLAVCLVTLAWCVVGAPTLELPAGPNSKLPIDEHQLAPQPTFDANTRQHHDNLGGRLVIQDNHDTELGRTATWSKEPSTPGPGKHHPHQQHLHQVKHETKTAILLTNGHQIKLYPLGEEDLIPSGGYYVIKSLEQFNLSDSRVIEALGRDSAFTKFLKHKQRHIELKLSSGNSSSPHSVAPSILPKESTKRKAGSLPSLTDIVSEDELFSIDNLSGWKRPLISDVGYMLDDRFCDRPVRANNCLVVFWLDKRNKYLRYGSYEFTDINRVQLLSSRFDAHGNLKSLTDENRKTIWLHEFPPVELCSEARAQGVLMWTCEIETIEIDRIDRNIRVGLRYNDDIIFPADLNMEPQRLFDINFHVVFSEHGVQVRSSEPAWRHHCREYWFDEKHVLYSRGPDSQDVELVEKMSSKPAIRMLDKLRLHKDTLFFNDLATRSIMSTNVTHRREIRSHGHHGSYPKGAVGKRKFHTIQRLKSTHQVLIVEPSIIESFDIVNLGGDDSDGSLRGCSPRGIEAAEPRVINDDLSENITKQKIETGYDNDMVREVLRVAFFVLAMLLILFGAMKRNQRLDKSDVARYNEIQT